MNSGKIFFQHPIGLWNSPPYERLSSELGPTGEGVYWRVFETIRLGGGIDSLDHLLSLFDYIENTRQRSRIKATLKKVLGSYGLFAVTQQKMVTIIDHTAEIKARNKAALDGPGLFDDLME